MVTVVDAVNFLNDYDEAKYLQDTGESLGEEDDRSVADLLVDQVEFADVLIISKIDLVEPSEVARLSAILRTLNREAKIIPISRGEIDLDHVLNTGLFDFEKGSTSAGWLQRCGGSTPPKATNMASEVSPSLHAVHSIPRNFMSFYITLKSLENYCVRRAIFGWHLDQSSLGNGARRVA